MDNNDEKYEIIKKNTINNYNEKLNILKKNLLLLKESQQNNDQRKIGFYENRIRNLNERVNALKSNVDNLRPINNDDVQLRSSLINNYAKAVDEAIPDGIPIVFHGNNNIGTVIEIIKSGGLLTPDQRGVDFKSQACQIDVTAKTDIRVSLEFAESNNYYLPYGAIFAFMPLESEYEKVFEAKGSSEVFNGVDGVNFKQEKDRLVSIITTKENIEKLKKVCEENNIDSKKVLTHEQFLEMCKIKYNDFDSKKIR